MKKTVPHMKQGSEAIQIARRATLNTASDLLKGAAEIAQFVFGDERDRRIVYYLVEREQIPVIRLGRRIYARKSTLERWLLSKEEATAALPELSPVEVRVVVADCGAEYFEYQVHWKGRDGFQRLRGAFTTLLDAETYAAQLRCGLDADVYQAELKEAEMHNRR